jgi:hypothetical protein
MANPWAGEVAIRINDTSYDCKLTLGALAELEAHLQSGSLVDLVTRFEQGAFSSRDVMAVIVAGLRGAGWRGQPDDLVAVDLGGGALGAARLAATLLARAFSVPQ